MPEAEHTAAAPFTRPRRPVRFTDLHARDLAAVDAGRCLHRVGRIVGPSARITVGGFLALTQAQDGVVFWS